jgi:sugar lactone lactonase YvrE
MIPLLLLWLLQASAADRRWTEEYPAEAAAANKDCAAKDYASCRQHLLRLRDLLSGRGDVVYKLAAAEAAAGNRAAALQHLTRFSQMGLTFADPESQPEFAALRDAPEFREALAKLRAARQPVSHSSAFVALSPNDMIAEDIAFDSVKSRFYVSSVRHGKIVSLSAAGGVSTGGIVDFVPSGQPDIWAILALHADAKRRILWATTAAMPEFAGYRAADEGKSALLKYSLDSGALLKRYDLPSGSKHALGDMTLSRSGDVFVSDGYGPVYWVEHRTDRLEVLVPPGTFNSPQTPALSADGRRLFVPDYSRGISVVDLASRQTKLLEHPATLSLGGIDGLYLVGRTMIATQNGTAPRRVILLQLDAGLTRIESGEVLEANWDGLGDPTHGVVVGSDFYFIVNAGWDNPSGGTPAIRHMRMKE